MPERPLEEIRAQLRSAERRALTNRLLLKEADKHNVVWAYVKGYAHWPAQVLNHADAERHKVLGKASHRKDSVPVMFFGTLEVAWIGSQHVVSFKKGVQMGYLTPKSASSGVLDACNQVLAFLVLRQPRVKPTVVTDSGLVLTWWCDAPPSIAGGGEDDDVPMPEKIPGKVPAPEKASKKRKKGRKGGGGRAAQDDDSGEDEASDAEPREEPDEQEESDEMEGVEVVQPRRRRGAQRQQQRRRRRQQPKPQRSSSSEPSHAEAASGEPAAAADGKGQGDAGEVDMEAASRPDEAAAAPMDTDQAEPEAEPSEEQQEAAVTSPRGRRGRQPGGAKAAGGRPPVKPSASGSQAPAKRAQQANSLTSSRSEVPPSRTLSEQPAQAQLGEAAADAAAAAAAGRRVSQTTGSGGTGSQVPTSSTSTRQRAAEDDSKAGLVGARDDSKLGSSEQPREAAAEATTEMAAPPTRPAPRKRQKIEAAHTSSDGAPAHSGDEQQVAGAPAGPEGVLEGADAAALAAPAAVAAATAPAAPEDAPLQPALQVKVSTVSSTSLDAPATAPPSANATAAAAQAVFDDDIYKLPAEIRRLAGIKLVKKPTHAPAEQPQQQPQHQAASSTRPPKQVPAVQVAKQEDAQAADSPRRDREKDAEGGVRASDDGATDVVVPVRRETRSGAGPRGPSSKGGQQQPGSARSSKAAASAQQHQDGELLTPSSPTATLERRGSGPLDDPRDKDRQQRALEREQQLQRKRERERERRQQIKERQRQQQEAEAAAGDHSGSSSDSEDEAAEEGDAHGMEVEPVARDRPQQQQPRRAGALSDAGAADADLQPSAAAVKPEQGDHDAQQPEQQQDEDAMQVDGASQQQAAGVLLVDRSNATIDCSIMPSMPTTVPAEALIAQLEGCLNELRSGSYPGFGPDLTVQAGAAAAVSCPASPVGVPDANGLPSAGSLPPGKPPRPAGSTGRVPRGEGRGSKPVGKGRKTSAAGGAPSPTAVPVVSVVAAGSRKQSIPPVLAAPTTERVVPVVQAAAANSKRSLLTKRSIDSVATSSDNGGTASSEHLQGAAPAGSAGVVQQVAYEEQQLLQLQQQPQDEVVAAAAALASTAATGAATAAAVAATVMDAGPSDAAAAAAGVATSGVSVEDLLDAEAAEALQFMQSQSLNMESAAMGAAAMMVPPPPLQPLPSPVLSELEAALGAVMSAHGLSMTPVPPTPAEPAIYKPPRKASVAECAGFMWPSDLEPHLPMQHEFFYLPAEWLIARPPKYEVIKRSVWLSKPRPKRLHREEVNVCQCKPPLNAGDFVGCGKNCLNRMSFVLCDTKYCPCGEACANKPFQYMKCPRIEAFLTNARGYGVRACVPIKAHQFVIEYVGEVIDEKELARRMEAARTTAQHSYYIMELAPNTFLDARHKGNVARLLNSSCNPNCETQKWHDAATGEPRIGIFAKRDIQPGEELTYDYFFEQYSRNGVFNAAQFKCMCGATNCRGTMDNPALNSRKNKDYGRRIEVYWDEDGMYYPGTIVGYSVQTKRHVILYDDGDQEKLVLDEVDHRWLDAGPAGASNMATTASAPALLQQAGPSQRWSGAAGTAGAAWSAGAAAVGAAAQLAAYASDAGDMVVDEAVAEEGLLAQRSSIDALGQAAAAGGAAKKKQRMVGGHTNNSMLPQIAIRTGGLDNSYNSTSTTFNVSPGNGLPHAVSAPAAFSTRNGRERSSSYNGADNGAAYAGGSVFGGDMESLLQAVEVELGGREAAAAAGNSAAQPGVEEVHHQPMQIDGGRHHAESSPPNSHVEPIVPQVTRRVVEVPPPVVPPQHSRSHGGRGAQSLPSPQTGTSSARTPRNGHGSVKSPSHRRGQQQQQQQAVAGTWGGVHTVAPSSTHYHHHAPPAGHMDWATWGNGHAHPALQQVPLQQHQPVLGAHADVQGYMQGLQQAGHLAAGEQAAGAAKAPAAQPVIEEMLGIRISQFEMPLFQPNANGLRSSTSRQVTPNFGHSLIAAATTGAGAPEIPPHLQRMPITTSSPGLGPTNPTTTTTTSHPIGMLPPVSSQGPSPTLPAAAAPGSQGAQGQDALPGRSSSHPVLGSNGRSLHHGIGSSQLSEALATLVNSPILAAMSGLPGGLRGYETLAAELDLFKRAPSNNLNGKKRRLEEQPPLHQHPVNGYPVASLPPVVTVGGGVPLVGKAAAMAHHHVLPPALTQLH